jgi:AraC-like DNA-binding protein
MNLIEHRSVTVVDVYLLFVVRITPFESSTSMFNIRYFAPHPRLRHLIRNYYLYDVTLPDGATIQDRFITEYANFRVVIGGKWIVTTKGDGEFVPTPINLAGPNSYPTLVTGTGSFRTFGMGVQPLGWTALVDAPACELADHLLSAVDFLGADTTNKIGDIVASPLGDDAMIDAIEAGIICRLQKRATRLSPIVRAVQDLIATQPINRVDDLSVRVETSSRQLERLSKEAFGFSPKTMLRRARIRRTVEAMKGYGNVDWESQVEQDFADQSHLIHEFRRFTGLTPTAYLNRPSPLMDVGHAMQAALHRKMSLPQLPDCRLKAQIILDATGSQIKSLAEAA